MSEGQKQVRHQAEVMSVASAIGVLQRCRATKVYIGNPDIVEDTFYRMAGIMRKYILNADNDPRMAELAVAAHEIYKISFQTGELMLVIEKDLKLVPTTTPVETEAQCKTTETTLINVRQKGRLLDVAPVTPITPPKGQNASQKHQTLRYSFWH